MNGKQKKYTHKEVMNYWIIELAVHWRYFWSGLWVHTFRCECTVVRCLNSQMKVLKT